MMTTFHAENAKNDRMNTNRLLNKYVSIVTVNRQQERDNSVIFSEPALKGDFLPSPWGKYPLTVYVCVSCAIGQGCPGCKNSCNLKGPGSNRGQFLATFFCIYNEQTLNMALAKADVSLRN